MVIMHIDYTYIIIMCTVCKLIQAICIPTISIVIMKLDAMEIDTFQFV